MTNESNGTNVDAHTYTRTYTANCMPNIVCVIYNVVVADAAADAIVAFIFIM